MIGFSFLLSAMLITADPQVFHAQGEMAGEVSPTSVILQSRLTSVAKLTDGDLAGVAKRAVTADDDEVDLAALHQVPGGIVGDDVVRDALLRQLPRGEDGPL